MRLLLTFVLSALLPGTAASAAAQAHPGKAAKTAAKTAAAPASNSLLPESFAGWVATETPKAITDPAMADPANANALKEYDFADGMLASYKRDGDTLAIKALRFHDVSGSYGTYSFYRHDGWPKENIGMGATSDKNRVLFWTGDTVIDATFSRVGPMSGSELRELASQIPVPAGTKALAPPILRDLPQTSLEGQSTHYAVGPAGYQGAGGVLPPELVGFDRGAEVVTAGYSLTSNPATLTIINYPTPQMAAAQETRLRAYIKAGGQAQPAWPKPLQDSDTASLEVRRSGPLVALVSGDAIPEESHKLLGMVHYDADLTSVPVSSGGDNDVKKTARLLLGIAGIVIIGVSAALLLGFFLGGGRALYRIARGKPASSMYEAEFTSINLHEEWVRPAPSVDSPHPKG